MQYAICTLCSELHALMNESFMKDVDFRGGREKRRGGGRRESGGGGGEGGGEGGTGRGKRGIKELPEWKNKQRHSHGNLKYKYYFSQIFYLLKRPAQTKNKCKKKQNLGLLLFPVVIVWALLRNGSFFATVATQKTVYIKLQKCDIL